MSSIGPEYVVALREALKEQRSVQKDLRRERWRFKRRYTTGRNLDLKVSPKNVDVDAVERARGDEGWMPTWLLDALSDNGRTIAKLAGELRAHGRFSRTGDLTDDELAGLVSSSGARVVAQVPNTDLLLECVRRGFLDASELASLLPPKPGEVATHRPITRDDVGDRRRGRA